jgi:DNA-binding MarR family transcriptional regulator
LERIEDCISFLAGKAAQQVSRRARDMLAPHGVTPVQYAVLRVLWEDDGQSGATLSARLAIDSATITGVIDRLEGAGLIERRPDGGGDRRIHRVVLTDKGRALQVPLDALMVGLNADVRAELGEAAGPLWAALAKLGGIRRKEG